MLLPGTDTEYVLEWVFWTSSWKTEDHTVSSNILWTLFFCAYAFSVLD